MRTLMRRHRLAVWVSVVVATACVTVAMPATAQSTRQQREACLAANASPPEKLQACSELIEYGNLDKQTLAHVYTSRGNVHDDLDHLDAALADYTSALALMPDLPFALRNRAVALYRRNRNAEALPDLDRALELDPKYGAAFEIRAAVLLAIAAGSTGAERDALLTRALADSDRSLELLPADSHARIYFGRAGIHRTRGDFTAAIADVNRAREADPAVAISGLMDRGSLYMSMAKLEQARADFSEVIASAPQNLSAVWSRAIVRFRLADFEGARTDLSTILAVQPDASRVSVLRAITYLRTGEYPKAIEDLARPLTEAPSEPALLYCAGQARVLSGDEGTGRPMIERARALRADVSVSTGAECAPREHGRRFAVGERVLLPVARESASGSQEWSVERDAYLARTAAVTAVGGDGAVKVDLDAGRFWWAADWLVPFPTP